MCGASLALLLSSSGLGTRDGLLFGRVAVCTHTLFQDDDDDGSQAGSTGMQQVQDRHTYITSTLACASLCSFYDASGQVQGERLQELMGVGRDPIIGWFSSRGQDTLCQPSMRETAVTLSLQNWMQQQVDQSGQPPPVLMALLMQHPDHGGATLTLDYRYFYLSGGQPTHGLQPLELSITNLAQGLGHKAYEGLSSVMAHACSLARAAGAGVGQPPAAGLTTAAEAALKQVADIEGNHQALLRELQAVCRQVTEGSAQLQQLEKEGIQLAAELAALTEPL